MACDSDSGTSSPSAKILKGLVTVLPHIEGQTDFGMSNLLPPREKLNTEIYSYLDHPSLEMDTDPFNWWKVEH